jgi:hypothetical protein
MGKGEIRACIDREGYIHSEPQPRSYAAMESARLTGEPLETSSAASSARECMQGDARLKPLSGEEIRDDIHPWI